MMKTDKIQAQRVPERVMEHLMNWIMDGRLHMGQKLVADDLARVLGVSRVPVREALKNLEKVGLVESIPYVGSRLALQSQNDIKQIYIARKALEPILGSYACLNATDEEIAEAKNIQDEYESVIFSGKLTAQEVFVRNRRFHFAIYRSARMDKITEIASMLWDNLAFCRLIYGQTYAANTEAAEFMMQEHRSFLEALQARNADLMLERMQKSLSRSEIEVPGKLAKFLEESAKAADPL